MKTPTFPVDFNAIRLAFINEIMAVTLLDQEHVVTLEPETPNWPRPDKPYIGMKITTPSAKSGDDSKQNVPDDEGNPSTVWNSGGVRKMTVSFEAYGNTHEEAYNYMGLWQTALDLYNTQAALRTAGVAVWVIGNVVDLSALLNTGFEGRAQMDCTFGIAMNLQSDLGSMEIVNVDGQVTTDQNETDEVEVTVQLPGEG